MDTSPANTILVLELKKFHELATNVRRLRLESPRGGSVGGGEADCSETGMGSDRALQMVKTRLSS